MDSPYRFVRTLTGHTIALSLCVITALVFLAALFTGRAAGPLGESLVAAQVLAALFVYARAARKARGAKT